MPRKRRGKIKKRKRAMWGDVDLLGIRKVKKPRFFRAPRKRRR